MGIFDEADSTETEISESADILTEDNHPSSPGASRVSSSVASPWSPQTEGKIMIFVS